MTDFIPYGRTDFTYIALCIALHCIALYCIALYIALHCIALHCIVHYALYCILTERMLVRHVCS
jgi:hypothetical protein